MRILHSPCMQRQGKYMFEIGGSKNNTWYKVLAIEYDSIELTV